MMNSKPCQLKNRHCKNSNLKDSKAILSFLKHGMHRMFAWGLIGLLVPQITGSRSSDGPGFV